MGNLKGKCALVYGGGGAIGGAAARAFAREGARVFLAGRSQEKLDAVAGDIWDHGGTVETSQVDAFDSEAVASHVDDIAARAGSIDILLNAIGIPHVQGTPFAELALDDYLHPITAYSRTHFITAQAVARHMVKKRTGVILALSTPGSRLPGPGFMGFGVACAAIETLCRHLAGELGASGIRVICLRPDAIPEALRMRSHSNEVFSDSAARAGMTIESMLARHALGGTLLKRLPTLSEVADFAAFVSSDRASAMTGAIANLTCGSLVD